MSRNSTLHNEDVLLRKHFYDLPVLHLHTRYAHVTGSTLARPYAGWERGRSTRTRGTKTVVLTVGLHTDTAEAVTLHNALETAALRGANDIHEIAFCKEIGFDLAAHFRKLFEVTELHHVVT